MPRQWGVALVRPLAQFLAHLRYLRSNTVHLVLGDLAWTLRWGGTWRLGEEERLG